MSLGGLGCEKYELDENATSKNRKNNARCESVKKCKWNLKDPNMKLKTKGLDAYANFGCRNYECELRVSKLRIRTLGSKAWGSEVGFHSEGLGSGIGVHSEGLDSELRFWISRKSEVYGLFPVFSSRLMWFLTNWRVWMVREFMKCWKCDS